MSLAASLCYDHEVLRGKLATLESFLPSLVVAPFTLSRLTESLATCLRGHTEREERLLDTLMRQQDEPPLALIQQLHDEHENQRTRLAILHELLTHPEPASEEQILTQASYLVKDLREHMAMEERHIFPIIDIDGEGVGEVTTAVDDEAVETLGLA